VRRLLLIILLLSAGAWAVPAAAQIIPDPSLNKTLYIRNKAGKIVERLQPHGEQYDVYDAKRQFAPIGYAKIIGRRLVMYDINNNITATARAEMVPPDSGLTAITIVRDRSGHEIGMLERY
jgi:hypothetical protein